MRSSSHVLPLSVLTVLLLSQVCSGIKWLALSHAPTSLHINQTQHCKMLPGLVSSQAQLCRSNLELMQTIIQAAREVKKTCQKTFADMRWNCSSIDVPIDAPKYRPDLDRGTVINRLE
nr:PREDICTED: protein Wnt-11-like [Paralichthys olivaceus]